MSLSHYCRSGLRIAKRKARKLAKRIVVVALEFRLLIKSSIMTAT